MAINYWLKTLLNQSGPVVNVYSMLGMIFIESLLWSPFVFLMLAAAFRSMDPSLEESAFASGASGFLVMRRITAPLLMPAITVALVFRSILAFKTFDEVFLLTGGGPGTSSELLSLHLYKVFFEQNQLGYGALLSLAIIAAIVAFLLVGRRAAKAMSGA
mgnify:CR=1 FL=1